MEGQQVCASSHSDDSSCVVPEQEGDASLQPEEGGSGGEEEELGNKKPGVDQSALRRAQGKVRMHIAAIAASTPLICR